MSPRRTRCVAVFGAVTAGCVAIGSVGAVLGIPANYGLTSAEVIALLDDRPVGWTVAWVCYALILLVAAPVRDRHIAQRKPWIGGTLVRGSIWLWGGIGAPWLYVWGAWDLQLDDLIQPVDGSLEGSRELYVAMWWWLGSLACLLIGLAWSGWLATRPDPVTPEASTSELATA